VPPPAGSNGPGQPSSSRPRGAAHDRRPPPTRQRRTAPVLGPPSCMDLVGRGPNGRQGDRRSGHPRATRLSPVRVDRGCGSTPAISGPTSGLARRQARECGTGPQTRTTRDPQGPWLACSRPSEARAGVELPRVACVSRTVGKSSALPLRAASVYVLHVPVRAWDGTTRRRAATGHSRADDGRPDGEHGDVRHGAGGERDDDDRADEEHEDDGVTSGGSDRPTWGRRRPPTVTPGRPRAGARTPVRPRTDRPC